MNVSKRVDLKYSHPQKSNGKCDRQDEVLAGSMMIIVSHYISISNQHAVYLKLTQGFVSITYLNKAGGDLKEKEYMPKPVGNHQGNDKPTVESWTKHFPPACGLPFDFLKGVFGWRKVVHFDQLQWFPVFFSNTSSPVSEILVSLRRLPPVLHSQARRPSRIILVHGVGQSQGLWFST